MSEYYIFISSTNALLRLSDTFGLIISPWSYPADVCCERLSSLHKSQSSWPPASKYHMLSQKWKTWFKNCHPNLVDRPWKQCRGVVMCLKASAHYYFSFNYTSALVHSDPYYSLRISDHSTKFNVWTFEPLQLKCYANRLRVPASVL